MERKKLGVTVATVALCGALGGAMALAGCATPTAATGEGSNAPNAEASEKPASEMTMQDWGKQFPLQYNSYHKLDMWPESETRPEVPHGHFTMLLKEAGPVAYSEQENARNGQVGTELMPTFAQGGLFSFESMDFDPETGSWVVDDSSWVETITAAYYNKGCYACRSSKFNEVYEENGAEAFSQPIDEEYAETLNGQMWDCATCHDDNPENEADANLIMWKELSRDTFDSIDPKNRSCGQCHNTLDYRTNITDQKTMDSFAPYRNGFDVDQLYDAAVEDGVATIDEETGLTMTVFENQFELFQNSPHDELGVTCVDCHMPKVTDPETGETYTDHNASGSPLEKDASMEYCLTCHKAQGISSIDEMRAMVKDRRNEAKKKLYEIWDKRDKAKSLVADAVASGTADEATLDEAREKWSRAYARIYMMGSTNTGGLGSRTVHNPQKFETYLSEANAMLDEVISALS